MVVVSSTFAVPAEGVLHQTPSTKLIINDQELGTATLYITENSVIWGGGISATGGALPTITLLYPHISLHAIQREPSPALYMVLNYELRLAELNQPAEENDDDDDDFDLDDQPITQLRFVPQNEADLNPMFSALSQGQTLHPDPVDEVFEDLEPYIEECDEGIQDILRTGEFSDEEFEDAEESNASPEDAAARLHQLRLENSNGQHYEDCEDPEAAEE